MKTLTFSGGVHPPDFKGATETERIKVISPNAGDEFTYPMSQHIGAPCAPVVKKGDDVAVGQKIGEAVGLISAPVHSSVSGVVKSISDVITPTGVKSQAIVIECDGENREHQSLNNGRGFEGASRAELVEIIKEAGVVGLGGAGFPAHVKLNPPADKRIDTIILNAAECEPYLTTDYRVLLEETDVLIEGLRILLTMHTDARGVIAVEDNKRDAIELIKGKIKDEPRMTVAALKTKYPQGAEKQLIYACAGREVPSGKLPMDVRCIVHNADTVIAVQRAVVRGRPLMRRIVTLSGGAIKNPGNYKVRIGMKLADLVNLTGGLRSEPRKIISGGPMMGAALFSMDVPIIKTSSAFLFFTEEEAKLPEERPCIRCARCVERCPMKLYPFELNQYAVRGEYELFKKRNGEDCIECGVCSYVCPAKRHLAQSIRSARGDSLRRK
ncbi:MAG: electron transport complex subunit RsxC [Clostridiales bacterium]|jgi:electron transport complex protein RnfC|nr:electron transport complex subunit RsxC [Clostridiales bacterium]